MNSKGFRGPEYSYEKANNEYYRILFLGDSFAEGYTVEFDQLLSEVLRSSLNNGNSQNFEVINAGTGGYSTDQEFLFFRDEGKKYSPDLTILLFFDNDVWYNSQALYGPRGSKPLFQLDDGGSLELTNVPVPKPAPTSGNVANTSRTDAFEIVKTWFFNSSHLYQFTRDSIKNSPFLWGLAVKARLTRDPTEGVGNDGAVNLLDVSKVYAKTPTTDVSQAWKITEAILVELKEEAASIDSELLVFYVPGKASVYSEDWEAMKRQYAPADESWSIERVEDELVAICERNDIDCLDSTERFKAQAKKLARDGESLYFRNDAHWNSAGHNFVGQLLAEHITARYLRKQDSQ